MKHTLETRLKMSRTRKGVPHSKEHSIKIGLAQRGKIISEETKEKLRLINLGKKHTEETKNKIGKSILGEKHGNWKGNDVGYRALHGWITRQLGKASRCEDCKLEVMPEGMKRYFQWANISHEYKRDVTDWKQLCVKCHKQFDSMVNSI